jgi:hypothetical protein
MILAIAVLLIHPQLATTVSLSADKAAIKASAGITTSTGTVDAESSLPFLTASLDAATQPLVESSAALPEAPMPIAVNAPVPIAFLRPAHPMTVSVAELRGENRRKEMMWKGLVIATSGAATFDAWTTRRAISTYGAQELNPMLRPFAGNASLYAAIQVGPVLMDFVGKKMMYSSHPWVRRMWWVPQSASFASSIFCGAHNLAFR